MDIQNPQRLLRLLLAALIPFIAGFVQWIFWSTIRPYVWFLFYPAVFFSSWIGGLAGGLVATLAATTLVIFLFIPPEFSFAVESPESLYSVGVFMGMGILFSLSHGRLRQANQQAAAALEAARDANEQLQGANEKITRLYEKTRELDDLKTRFFANVSHELRTPLALILGPVAKRLTSGDLAETERRDLEVMHRNARLLHRHVSDLLDVAKLEAGRMVMQYAQVDLSAQTRYIAAHFRILAEEKQIRYTAQAEAPLPAQIDAEKFQRILLNLLSNAFKFTPDHGTITLTLHADADRAVLCVQDDGPGVPASLREAIFEPFRQVEGGTVRRYGGTGLGLAIVKEFVELHGGTIAVTDAPGGGARFTVVLPLAAPAGVELQPAPGLLEDEIDRQALDELRLRPPTPALSPATAAADAPLILVVEDNPDMNAYVAEALGRHYRIATAFDGEEGLAAALALRPDLIVSDVMMPKLSGDQMVLALRRHPGMAHVPIVMLTAKADDALRVQLLREGVQDYLAKPFVVEELLARVGGLLAERQRTEEALRRLNADLERRVEERTAELTAANRELDSFAYAVSHDLRAPLRAMSGFSQALVEDFGGSLPEEARGYLEQISWASRHMGQLIEGLLTLSRSIRGELRRERVELSLLAERLLGELAQAEPERHMAWEIEPELIARGDPRMIEVVMSNLLGNAWKYTAGTAAPLIRVYGEVDGDKACFCVADNGAGFDMQHADKLFQPFSRLHRQDEFPGIGIGLATAQRIVHRHGGTIRATAAPAKGATFRFSL